MAIKKIPIIVVLWEDRNFRGRRVVLTEDAPLLSVYGAGVPPAPFAVDIIWASSIAIHPGPDYDLNVKYEVSFYQLWWYKGGQLVLTPGLYPDLRWPYNFDNKINSVKFNQGIPVASEIKPIPVVGELYTTKNFRGRKLIVVENVKDLGEYSGFDERTESVKVIKGPDYTAGKKLYLHPERNYGGGELALPVGDYPDLESSHQFSDVTSSVQVEKMT